MRYSNSEYQEGEFVSRNQMLPIFFVEVMPSVLHELTKKDAHLLHPAWVLQPNSEWLRGYPEERNIYKAFKKFASRKQPVK
jgi:hypothetical protein